MKKFVAYGLVLLLCVSSANVCLAAKDGQKGASEKAYEHASDNAIFNRVGDWFATIGKSDVEKEKILAERKAERAAKRAEKMAQKEAKKAEKGAKKKIKGAGSEMEDTKKKLNKKLNR